MRVSEYGLKTILPPKNIWRPYLALKNNKNKEKIFKWFEKNYNLQKYLKAKKIVSLNFKKIEQELSITVEQILDLHNSQNFEVFLSFFGPGGSYKLPNIITIRVLNHDDLNYSNVNITHELIHLLVENKIQKYNFSHHDKELFVNSILFQPQIAKILKIKNEEIIKSKYYYSFRKYF
ncbi:MAG: hypothetical protein CEN91_321 [Candidatus Berkelbacteria bacterium Licking1014_85]|uniref:Uncharacterized protein n=1 Tax=Candidatus Berkelbacteria bacterium Licking1014_85 TaxID=2017148 RepID=A0A554LJI3_9BACT|nr:MAG: hypothetical protein CEN91_321 [Candidatus Berkelbacteria bacterium Licking1014_85]